MKQGMILGVLGVAVGVMVSACAQPEEAVAPEVGKPAPTFTLPNIDGDAVALDGFKGKLVVLEWTNYDCPFVIKHYQGGHMQALQKQYTEKGVVWLSICSSAPGKQGYFTPDEWKGKVAERNVSASAVLLDPDGVVGRLYGARTTPHMFVIDTDGKLAYMGAIDDNPSANAADVEGAVNYVKLALDALLEGRPVETPVTRPYGCSVKYLE